MWIKSSNGVLLNLDQMTAIGYRAYDNTTTGVCSDGSDTGPICVGNAMGRIYDAIQRDQKYLEVSDCE